MPIARLVFPCLAVLALGCSKSGSTEPPEPEPAAPPAAEEDEGPPVYSELGDGVVRGMVRLERGVDAPEGSKLEIRVMASQNLELSKFVEQHDVPVSGPGPWAFEFTVDTSTFDQSTQVGLGVMLTVPPDGAVWWASMNAIQVFKAGEEPKALEIVVSPMDPRAEGKAAGT